MSIIAEALKKAQKEREQSFNKTSSKLENLLTKKTGIIPKKYRNTQTAPPPSQPLFSKVNISRQLKTILRKGILPFLVFLLFTGSILMAYNLLSLKNVYRKRTENSSLHPVPILRKNLSPVENPAFVGTSGDNLKPQEKADLPVYRPEIPPVYQLPSLNGIMYSTKNPQAIIDGVLVSKGDTVDNFRVTEILSESVVISINEEEHEIKFRR